MLYVHYLLAILVAAQVLFLLLFQRVHARLIVSGTIALVFGFVLWLPWFPTFVGQVSTLRNVESASGMARGAAGIGVTTQVTSAPAAIQFTQMITNGVVWLYALALLAGVWQLRRKSGYWLALFWGLGVPTIALVANSFLAVYTPRYVSHSIIGLGLALGAGLLGKPSRLRISVTAIFVAVNLLAFPTQFPARIPYRDLYAEVSAQAREGDAVLLLYKGKKDGFAEWQADHYLPPFLVENTLNDVIYVQPYRRVWFFSDDLFGEAAQNAFNLLEPSHPVQSVIGQCNREWCYVAQLMEAPPLVKPQLFGDSMEFWGIDVDSVNATEISTRLWWRVDQVPTLDYSIGLHLFDAEGSLVAQSDGEIQHYGVETVPTSRLQAGQIYIDFRTIHLPLELAPGKYGLALVVYQSWDGTRLTLPDGRDGLVVDTVRLD
jgi:hypothetical protein